MDSLFSDAVAELSTKRGNVTAKVENHPAANLTPEMVLRAALQNAHAYSSVVVVAFEEKTGVAEVHWSEVDMERLVYLERVLNARITAEFIDE